MKISEAIAILAAHNAWRRGGDDPATDPAELGKAIDLVVAWYEAVFYHENLAQQKWTKPTQED